MTLFNRDVNRCKIAKVNLETMQVEKVSSPLKIYHANGITLFLIPHSKKGALLHA